MPSSYGKKNLRGRGLTKVEKHWPRSSDTVLTILMMGVGFFKYVFSAIFIMYCIACKYPVIARLITVWAVQVSNPVGKSAGDLRLVLTPRDIIEADR